MVSQHSRTAETDHSVSFNLSVPNTACGIQKGSTASVSFFFFFYFFIVALCPRKRDGLLGTGTEWEGDDRVKARPRKTLRKRPERPWTVDRRQNNGSVKAVSPRHCPATCALRSCCFNCCALAESQRQCPLHRC